MSRGHRIARGGLCSLARRCILLIAAAVGSQSVVACVSTAQATESPGLVKRSDAKASGNSELGPARECLEHDNARCALGALAGLRGSAIAKTSAYLDLKAQALALGHRPAEALIAVQSAIQSDPSEPQYLITRGRIYLRSGNVLDAIESFLKAAKLEPQSPEPLYFLGTSFFLLAERTQAPEYYSRAERHFQLAVDLRPDYARAEFMLGVIDAMQSRLDAARTHLQQALQIEPRNPYFHLHYGILLKQQGKDPEALKEMKVSEELNRSYALTHYELGTEYQRLADYRTARSELELAVTLNPHLSVAYYHLGTVYSRIGMAKKSKTALEKFRLTKTLQEKENLDPAASAVLSEDPPDSRSNSRPRAICAKRHAFRK